MKENTIALLTEYNDDYLRGNLPQCDECEHDAKIVLKLAERPDCISGEVLLCEKCVCQMVQWVLSDCPVNEV